MQNSAVVKWALVLSIVIVLNLFFNFGIRAFYPEPKWDDFCPQQQVTVQPATQEECLAQGGAWTEGPARYQEVDMLKVIAPNSFCDLTFTCRQGFETASEIYNRNVFIALVLLGLVALGVSFTASKRSVPAFGLALGGLLSFVIAAIRYWSDMDEYLRVIILGLALAWLIWLGIKKFRE